MPCYVNMSEVKGGDKGDGKGQQNPWSDGCWCHKWSQTMLMMQVLGIFLGWT